MKRLWYRATTSKRSSAVLLCNALLVLTFTLSPLFVLVHASTASADPLSSATPVTVKGGGKITAAFIDASHVAIVATGNISFSYEDQQGNTFNTTTSLFPIQGVYYGPVSTYPSWGGDYSGYYPNTTTHYVFQNGQAYPGGSVCNNDEASLTIKSFDDNSGAATGTLHFYLPVEDSQSTSSTPTCEPVQVGVNSSNTDGITENVNIFNPSTGVGAINSLWIGAANDCGGSGDMSQCESLSYNTYHLADTASSSYFYESGGNIYASVYDTSLKATGGSSNFQLYQFSNPVKNSDGSVTYEQESQSPNDANYPVQDCPDRIVVPKGATGSYVNATYETWIQNNTSEGPVCIKNPTINNPRQTWPISLLTVTPETYLNTLAGVDTQTGTGGSGTQTGADTNQLPDCTSGGGSIFSYIFSFTKVLNWLLCAVINFALGTTTYMDNWIMSQLIVSAPTIFDTTAGTNGASYYTAWNSFRVIATGMLIIGGLVMIAAEAFGIELLDAYTIRKVLPRLIIAIIGISLSWPLMEFIINLFDTIGTDLGNIMFVPFASLGLSFGPSAMTGLAAMGGATAGILLLGPASLTFLLTALLAAFVGFIVLIIRQIVIIILIVLAPVAIACYILPGTQKGWKFWYDNFIGLMLMFPIVVMIIAAGHIFAAISFNSAKTASGGTQLVDQAMGLIAWFGVYFTIPMAARFATGIIGNVAGFVNDRHRGAFDRLKGVRQNATATNAKKIRNYSRFGDDSAVGRGVNTALGAISHPMRDLRRGRSGVQQGRQAGRAAMGAETLKNDAVFNANAHDDAFLYALSAGEERTQQKINGLRRPGASADDMAQAAMLEQGMATARGVKDHDSAGVRSAAFGALTQTGYQIGQGQTGYNEMAEIAADVTGARLSRDASGNVTGARGGDTGAWVRQMNNAQYNQGNAGRFDLAGVNNGQGYNRKMGLDKADPYTIGRSKKQTVREMGTAITEHVREGDRLTAAGDTNGAHAQYLKASQYKQEVQGIYQSAKGDVRDAAQKAYSDASGHDSLNTWESNPDNLKEASVWARNGRMSADDAARSNEKPPTPPPEG
jgi:hypothetical protein